MPCHAAFFELFHKYLFYEGQEQYPIASVYEAILVLHVDIASVEFVHHHYVRFSFLKSGGDK